ncbi:hypothetical protein HDU91_002425, partial [Kappamyces sp. JEL0680]
TGLRLVKESKVVYSPTSLLPEPIRSFAKDTGMVQFASHRGPLPCFYAHGGMHGCVQHTLHVFRLGVTDALKLYAPLNIIAFLFRLPSLSRKNARRRVENFFLSCSRSSAFLGAFIALIWGSICVARHTFNPLDGPSGPMLGSFLSGFSVLLEHPGRRRQLALYCLPKAVDSFWSTHIPRSFQRQFLPLLLPLQLTLFSSSMTYLLYMYRHHAKSMSPIVHSLFNFFLSL